MRGRVPLAVCLLVACAAACADERGGPPRGCTPDHDAAGTYRFSPGYLDERLRLLEASLRIEERPYDREALVEFVDGMRRAWSEAVLVLSSDGRFDLAGVVHAEVEPVLRGTWEVRVEATECRLVLRGGGQTLRALLGEGWVIPWFEQPEPGVVLDVQLVREER